MSEENVEIMRRANVLANEGGWDALLDEMYHADVVHRRSPLGYADVTPALKVAQNWRSTS